MIHGLLFKPAIGVARVDDHDFGWIVFLHPFEHGLANRARGEILAFCINELLGALDMFNEQVLDLVDLVPFAVGGASSGDADFDILECRLQPVGPQAPVGALDGKQGRTPCPDPAIAAQIAERIGNLAFHHHGRVMPGFVPSPARRLAQGFVLVVIARVPALHRHVDSAADGQRIVEHGDLLVVAASGGVRAVELEVDSVMPRPAGKVPPHRSAHDEFENAEAPFEHADFQSRSMPDQPADEAAQPDRILSLSGSLPPAAAFGQMDAGVEIPADQKDAIPCFQHRFLHRREIIRGVDEDGRPIHLGKAPDARGDTIPDARHRFWIGRIFALFYYPLIKHGYSFASSFFSGVTSASSISSFLRRSKTERMCSRSFSSRYLAKSGKWSSSSSSM